MESDKFKKAFEGLNNFAPPPPPFIKPNIDREIAFIKMKKTIKPLFFTAILALFLGTFYALNAIKKNQKLAQNDLNVSSKIKQSENDVINKASVESKTKINSNSNEEKPESKTENNSENTTGDNAKSKIENNNEKPLVQNANDQTALTTSQQNSGTSSAKGKNSKNTKLSLEKAVDQKTQKIKNPTKSKKVNNSSVFYDSGSISRVKKSKNSKPKKIEKSYDKKIETNEDITSKESEAARLKAEALREEEFLKQLKAEELIKEAQAKADKLKQQEDAFAAIKKAKADSISNEIKKTDLEAAKNKKIEEAKKIELAKKKESNKNEILLNFGPMLDLNKMKVAQDLEFKPATGSMLSLIYNRKLIQEFSASAGLGVQNWKEQLNKTYFTKDTTTIPAYQEIELIEVVYLTDSNNVIVDSLFFYDTTYFPSQQTIIDKSLNERNVTTITRYTIRLGVGYRIPFGKSPWSYNLYIGHLLNINRIRATGVLSGITTTANKTSGTLYVDNSFNYQINKFGFHVGAHLGLDYKPSLQWSAFERKRTYISPFLGITFRF